MTDTQMVPPPPPVPTGVPGLEELTNGGLFKGGVYIVSGKPGAGKTIFANQICFNHVRSGGRAVYATMLSETHGRLLSFLQQMKYFDPAAVGSSISYVNGYTTVEKDGLPGLMTLLRGAVREQKASILVVDGMVTAAAVASSDLAYKRFIQELQTWVEMIGCTVLLLTSTPADAATRPEHTMVDGIIEFDAVSSAMRRIRQVYISKFRGSAFLEGRHSYEITDAGIVIHPRVEALYRAPFTVPDGHDRLGFGIPKLDKLVGGVRRGSVTMLLGSSGAGKTVLGMHYLAAGLAQGERGLHFGFYEDPATVLETGDRFGFEFTKAHKAGLLHALWQAPAERSLDQLIGHLIEYCVRERPHRLFIDGIDGFRETSHPERITGCFAALRERLRSLGVTTVYTAAANELFVQRLEIPLPGISAVTENMIFMRQLESHGDITRALSVMKTRDRKHDRSFHLLDITDKGLRIGSQFDVGDTILSGPSRKGSRKGWRLR